jgi:hypothetical protein
MHGLVRYSPCILKIAVVAFASLVLLPATGHSDPLLFDNFDSGYGAWASNGNVTSEDRE